MSETSTSDLAARLYERWRMNQDFYDAQIYDDWKARGAKPRPRWDRLDTVQQNIWRAVALEAVAASAIVLAERAL